MLTITQAQVWEYRRTGFLTIPGAFATHAVASVKRCCGSTRNGEWLTLGGLRGGLGGEIRDALEEITGSGLKLGTTRIPFVAPLDLACRLGRTRRPLVAPCPAGVNQKPHRDEAPNSGGPFLTAFAYVPLVRTSKPGLEVWPKANGGEPSTARPGAELALAPGDLTLVSGSVLHRFLPVPDGFFLTVSATRPRRVW
jgi:hypothetical protein